MPSDVQPPLLDILLLTLTNLIFNLNLKDAIGIAKDVVTIIALIIGGIWTYTTFIRRRQKHPRAQIEHDILHLPLTPDIELLHIKVVIRNTAEMILRIAEAHTRVQQIRPVTDRVLKAIATSKHDQGKELFAHDTTEIDWKWLNRGLHHTRTWKRGDVKELEPGESDEILWDVILPPGIQTILIYTYVEEVKRTSIKLFGRLRGRYPLGWQKTTVYDVPCHTKDLVPEVPLRHIADESGGECMNIDNFIGRFYGTGYSLGGYREYEGFTAEDASALSRYLPQGFASLTERQPYNRPSVWLSHRDKCIVSLNRGRVRIQQFQDEDRYRRMCAQTARDVGITWHLPSVDDTVRPFREKKKHPPRE